MNFKAIVIGGLVYYIVTFLLGMASGMIIHEGVLAETYKATATFWRPELMAVPPDMAALMPLWITTGLILSLIFAALYSTFGKALVGPGWQRGLWFGVAFGIFVAALYATMYGVFNLPGLVWIYWAIEGIVLTSLSAAVMGWATERFAGV